MVWVVYTLSKIVKTPEKLRKAVPGVITVVVKFRSPIKDCSSCRRTFLRFKNAWIVSTHFAIFSGGKQASYLMESNSIPANVRVVDGPTVLSGAIGMPSS